jgi:hypothetical protein
MSKRNPYTRTPEQKRYFERYANCEVCGRPAQHIHHIWHNRQNNSQDNLFSLCEEHHTGQRGVHIIGEIKWIDWNRLTKNPKWKRRYEWLKGKQMIGRT